MYASRKLIWLVALGFLLLAGVAFYVVWRLELQVMDEAWAGQASRVERDLGNVVTRLAREEFAGGRGDIAHLGDKLMTAAETNPAIADLALVTPERKVLRRFSRGGQRNLPCLAMLPLDRYSDHEHAPATLFDGRVGCLNFPVRVGGVHKGSVLVHTMRDTVQGELAGQTVKRTAVRLAPIFLLFYLALGTLLILAHGAARRWRLRAASAERIEALGAIAEGINHEIRNPLNAVALSLQLLERQQEDAETRKVVAEAHRQTKRIGETLEEFARFTRVSHLVMKRTSLGELVRSLGVEPSGDVVAAVDADKMRDAVGAMLGLLEAPRSATLEEVRGEWRITATGRTRELDAARVEKLFDPYLRRRPRDIGRGLALARAVFQAHGGDLGAHAKGGTLTLRGHAPLALPGEKE